MKKAYIIIGVIALIAIGLFGTAAANPDATQSMVQKLDAIISGIAGIDEEMDTNMTALKNDLDSIKSDIAALNQTKSDVSVVKTIVGNLETTVGTIDTSISTISSNIDFINNSVVKMEVGGDIVTGNLGDVLASSESTNQIAHWSFTVSTGQCHLQLIFKDAEGIPCGYYPTIELDGFETVEFDAWGWQLISTFNGQQSLYYTYTMTYP